MSKADLNYKGYTGSCEVSIEDKCLHGKIQFIDDLISYEGATVDDVKEAFEAAVDRYLDYCNKTGKPANKPYSGTFNVRVGPDLHRRAAKAAYKLDLGLNDYVTKAIECQLDRDGVTKIEHTHNHVFIFKPQQEMRRVVSSGSTVPQWEPLNVH